MTVSTKLNCKIVSCGKEFLVIPQEMKFYEGTGLPLPDHCPSCRHRQRMALRSERTLYQRHCDKCGASMLSVYPKEAPYQVYCQTCFWAHIG